MIQSTRGARGGYQLARRPEEITVQDIFDALEEEAGLVDCVNNVKKCSRVSICPTRDIWALLGEKIRETLSSVTLADLVVVRRRKAENNIMSNI